MLSYQHGYHAGNLADVHKHVALTLLLGRLRDKDKPFCFIDTHAGRGVYDLDSPEAQKTREADDGVRRLAVLADPVADRVDRTEPPVDRAEPAPEHARLPAAIVRYLDIVRGFNEPGRLRYYPGSPAIARALLRDSDRAILLELHPQEIAELRRWAGRDDRLSVHARDCFEGLPALLPPPIRRGLVLIDPSYEVKGDYDAVAELLRRAGERWPNGVFALWYPLLAEGRHTALLRRIARLDLPRTLDSEYRFARTGLLGSGLVIVNAPWQLEVELNEAMTAVATALPPDGSGRFDWRWITPP